MNISRFTSYLTHKTIIFAIAIISLTGCAGSHNSDNLSDGDSVNAVERNDSVAKDSTDQLVGKDDSPLDFILESEDRQKYEAGILKRMAMENPDYCRRLLNSKYDKFIVVDKRTMKVLLYDKYGRVLREYKMACSRNFGTKHKKGDNRTPEGFFSVEGKYDSTDWVFVDDYGNRSNRKGEFGPRFIRLLIPITWSIGIHGTASPWSLGGRVSHGCIRISNENIMELFDLVEPGMPVIVSPGIKDRKVNKQEGCYVPDITTEDYDYEAAVRTVANTKYMPDNSEDKSSESSNDSIPDIQEKSVEIYPDTIAL